MDDKASGIPKDSELRTYAINGKVMFCSVIFLFLVVLLMVCFQFYTRWLMSRARNRRSLQLRRRPLRSVSPNTAAASTAVPSLGLDPWVLKSLPTFVFSAAVHPKGLDCAVCLSEFEDKETGRVLPKCNHSFHTECIDMWFQSHSNCPLCRAPANPDFSSFHSQDASEIVVSLPQQDDIEIGSGSGSNALCHILESGSSDEWDTSPVQCWCKPSGTVGIAAELAPTTNATQETRGEIVEKGIGSNGDSGRSSDDRIPSPKRLSSLTGP
ncbi:hypothetical protein Nepgr_004441 [Nepenthes gracilis]|uniref:RING-type E3 ubiquitin transferase n=1 Tax=Nepenthes gracilis TaxID=150966 RepID=A0AAD3S1H0_NEPGR|nr:hypothetical protein Nepgr_004441 [Nepenthes gracilis]